MTTATGKRGGGDGKGGGPGSAPATASNRELRAAAQRESTLRSTAGHAGWTQRLRERLDGPVVAGPGPWRPLAALLLSVAGLGVSIYLTVDHFAKIPLVCTESGIVNCQKVTTSAQSHFLGIPVAVLGLAFFVAMAACNLPAAWRSDDARVHVARLALSVAGMAFVLYLLAAEFLIIGNICLWCTSVHVLTFLLFILVLTTVPAMLGWGEAAYATD